VEAPGIETSKRNDANRLFGRKNRQFSVEGLTFDSHQIPRRSVSFRGVGTRFGARPRSACRARNRAWTKNLLEDGGKLARPCTPTRERESDCVRRARGPRPSREHRQRRIRHRLSTWSWTKARKVLGALRRISWKSDRQFGSHVMLVSVAAPESKKRRALLVGETLAELGTSAKRPIARS